MNIVNITAQVSENYWNELDFCPTLGYSAAEEESFYLDLGFRSFSDDELDFFRTMGVSIEDFLEKCVEDFD